MLTRQQERRDAQRLAGMLPQDLWVEILRFLSSSDIRAALCASKSFASNAGPIWKAACLQRWPLLMDGDHPDPAYWRARYDYCETMELERTALESPEDPWQCQKVVSEQHRSVLAEWMVEVSWEGEYEATVVHKAVQYLDHCLTKKAFDCPYRLQLTGVACLRAAVRWVAQLRGESLADHRDRLDPRRFASQIIKPDGGFSPEQIVAETADVMRAVPEDLRFSPDAHSFLRCHWHLLTAAGEVQDKELFVFEVASFLLHLSLLDVSCSAAPPSLVAAGALAWSLHLYGHTPWSPMMEAFSSYPADVVAQATQRLTDLQGRCDEASTELRKLHLFRARGTAGRSHDHEATGGICTDPKDCAAWEMARGVYANTLAGCSSAGERPPSTTAG